MTISRNDLLAGKVDLSDVVDAATARIGPIAPGELLRTEWLEPLGITAYRLAKDIGVPHNRVTAILAGDRAITAVTALRLARYLGADAESWLNLQVQYDLAMERQAHGDKIEQEVRPRAAQEEMAGDLGIEMDAQIRTMGRRPAPVVSGD